MWEHESIGIWFHNWKCEKIALTKKLQWNSSSPVGIHKNWNWANCPLTGLKPNTGFNWVEDTITKPEVGVTPVS
jgi:hypothetical protein